MKGVVRRLFGLGAVWLALGPTTAALPGEKDVAVEKILNPLPAYDPFQDTFAAPLFFPDDVDQRARRLLTDALTHRSEALDDHVRFFSAKDGELQRERGTVTGITEQAIGLKLSAIADRQQRLDALKKSLAMVPGKRQKKLLEAEVQRDALTQADTLISQGRSNRWAALLNRLLGSVDLVSVLSGSYIPAAADSVMSQAVSAGPAEITLEERKALARYAEHLERFPEAKENEEVQKRIEVLERKKKSTLAQGQLAKAEEAAEKGLLDRALFHYETAALIGPPAKKTQDGLSRLKEQMQRQTEGTEKALHILSGEGSAADETASTDLLYALSLRDADAIEAGAAALEAAGRSSTPFTASVEDSRAVAAEIRGQHEAAKTTLNRIAQSAPSRERRRASALLQSPEYNLLESFHRARQQHRLQTIKYVLLGEDLLRKNLLYGTAPLVSMSPQGAAALAAANVIAVGTNLFTVLTANPVSHEPVLDKGVAYIREHPESQSASEVYRVLAEAYEEMGMYDQAVAYLQLAGGAAPEKIAALKEKTAQRLLQEAKNSKDRNVAALYLKAIIARDPESPAAKDAIQRLAELARAESPGLRVSKDFLMKNPELHGPAGLDLKPTLFDGNLSNMEMAERGIDLLSGRELLIHFSTPWGVQERIYPVSPETTKRFEIALRRKNYEVAIETLDRDGTKDSAETLHLPESILLGDLKTKNEPDGATPGFVREAAEEAGDFPKVLSHELLSENERQPRSTLSELPEMRGNISASGFNLRGNLPGGLRGDRLTVGADQRSPFAGVELPIPYLQGFIPVDFLIQGRPDRLSLYPKIHVHAGPGSDNELYR